MELWDGITWEEDWYSEVRLWCEFTLEEGRILDDQQLELGTGSLQAGLHVLLGRGQVSLLHLASAAGQAFGLAHLKIRTYSGLDKSESREGENSINTDRIVLPFSV